MNSASSVVTLRKGRGIAPTAVPEQIPPRMLNNRFSFDELEAGPRSVVGRLDRPSFAADFSRRQWARRSYVARPKFG